MSDSTTRKITFTYGNDTFETSYKVIGDLNIPVVFYDQVSIGQSSHIAGKPKWFWTLDLFMDALDKLLSHFGFSLAIPREACLLDTTQGAAALPDCVTSLLRVQDVHDVLKKHEADGTTDSQEYRDATQFFNNKHSFAACEANTTVYHTIFGHNEFICTGTRKTWYCMGKLHNMSSTTLLFNGANDEAQDKGMMSFFSKIGKSKWVQFAHSIHMVMYEEKERYVQVVGDFLTTA